MRMRTVPGLFLNRIKGSITPMKKRQLNHETETQRVKNRAVEVIGDVRKRFGIDHRGTGYDQSHYLRFILELFQKSPHLFSLFTRSLMPYPGLAMRNLVTAFAMDDAGVWIQQDHPRVAFLMNLSLALFLGSDIYTAPDGGDADVMLPRNKLLQSAILDFFMKPLGDVQRRYHTVKAEADEIRGQMKQLKSNGESAVIKAADEANEGLKEQVRKCRQTIRDLENRITFRCGSEDALEKYVLHLSQKTAQLEELLPDQKAAKKQLDQARRNHPLDPKVTAEIAALDHRLKELMTEVNTYQATADDLEKELQTRKSPAGVENWPRNIRAGDATIGMDLWPFLVRPEFKKETVRWLKMCVKNAKWEYADMYSMHLVPKDAGGYVVRQAKYQNMHPWRQFWRDVCQFPLEFLKMVGSTSVLEGLTPQQKVDPRVSDFGRFRYARGAALNMGRPFDLSIYLWRDVLISSQVREDYMRVMDHPLAKLMDWTPEKAGQWLDPVAGYAAYRQNSYSENRHKHPRFIVPPIRMLNHVQLKHDEMTGDYSPWFNWYDMRFHDMHSLRRDLRLDHGPDPDKTRQWPSVWELLRGGNTSEANLEGRNLIHITINPDSRSGHFRSSVHMAGGNRVNFILPHVQLSWHPATQSVVIRGFYRTTTSVHTRCLGLIDIQGSLWTTVHWETGHVVDAPVWNQGCGNVVALLDLLEAGPKHTLGRIGVWMTKCCCCCRPLISGKSQMLGLTDGCVKRYKLDQYPQRVSSNPKGPKGPKKQDNVVDFTIIHDE